jgi:hypothetical protein
MTRGRTVGERSFQYAPRSLTALPPEESRSWTIKRYAVSALRPAPPDEVLELARRAVDRSLPDAYPDALSVGYSVVHEDEDGCYVVVGWWSRNRVILHTRTWLADWDDLTTLVEAPAHATACIWELVAMGHERDAWVRHVVQPDIPDIDAFLRSTVSGQF